jgi:hypothetical protein
MNGTIRGMGSHAIGRSWVGGLRVDHVRVISNGGIGLLAATGTVSNGVILS